MNSLKSLFFVAILAAAACGVYVTLNRNPEAPLGMGQCPLKIDMGTPMGAPAVAPSPANNAIGNSVPDFPDRPPNMMPPATGTGGYANQLATANGAPGPMQPGYYPPPPNYPSNGSSSDATLSLPPPPSIAPSTSPSAPSQSAPPLPSAPTATSMAPAAPAVATDSSMVAMMAGNTSPAAHDGPAADNPVKAANFAEPSTARAASNSMTADPGAFDLKALREKVDAKNKSHQYAEALTELTLAYDNPEVSPNDQTYVVGMLDMLAGEVIYSRKHLLEKPYIVQSNDTIESIADYCKVPALLLIRINGLRNPQSLAAGSTLKVVHGPFNATISIRRMEMTVYLAGRYAGRFPVNLGSDPARIAGMYTVRNKRSMVDTPVASAEALQGGGKPWIDLGDQSRGTHLNLQGTADLHLVGQGSGSGTVYLSDQDMDDVYGILSMGSSVVIKQ